jgi:GT2 family glycosyltransferase
MSYRRKVLAELGGFREDYPGISGLCEDTDMCLRVKGLGYKILFNPCAAVDHIGAPQAVGRRFDHRWVYFGTRNHTCLLIRNFGLFHPILARHFIRVGLGAAMELLKKYAAASLRCAATAYGALSGLTAGTALLISKGSNPVRNDPAGKEIASYLADDKSKMTISP